MISDANFPTASLSKNERMRRINDVLHNQPDAAVLTRDGVNYAFRGGVRIVIPYTTCRCDDSSCKGCSTSMVALCHSGQMAKRKRPSRARGIFGEI